MINVNYVLEAVNITKRFPGVLANDNICLNVRAGATLGGNLTPIGASANITAVGLLRQNGYETSFGDFMRIGVPFTLTAVAVAYLYLWIVW